VRTAIGVQREIESYNLTVKYLGLDGKPVTDATTGLFGLDNTIWKDIYDGSDGTVTVRLPKGRYALEGRIPTGSGSEDLALLMQPKFALTKDTTLVMDARRTKPVRVTVPDAAAKNTDAMLNFDVDIDGNGYTSTYLPDSFGSMRFGQLGAKVPAAEAVAQYSGTWTHGTANYRLAWNRTGDLSGFTQKLRRSQLTKVNVQVGALAKRGTVDIVAAPLQPGSGSWFDFAPTTRKLPLTGADFVLPNGVKWHYAAYEYGPAGSDGEPVFAGGQSAAPVAFASGKDYTLRFNFGVFGPAIPSGALTPGEGRPGAVRLGDTFGAYVPLFSDGAGHLGTSEFTKARSSLYAGGTKVFATDSPLDGNTAYTLPAGTRTYRLSTDVSRSSALFPVSTRVAAEWTFSSAHVGGTTEKPLPLSVVRFTPKLSAASTAKAGTAFTVPFTIQGAAKTGTLRKLAFQVSYDNGKTWKKAPVVHGKQLKLRHPAKAVSVSLRVSLTDADGNTLKQTIWRAYRTVK
jgi:hypothetical protein